MLRVPHTFVLLFVLIVMAAALTWAIPAGQYDRVERDGRILVDPGSYRSVAARPAGLADIVLAYPRGLAAVANIVFFIFLIGGAFGVVQATGAIDAALGQAVRVARGRGPVVLAGLTVLFSIAGGTMGMAEETLPFIPGLVVLMRRLGYDEVTGCAVALAGAGAGFSGAFLNPFTIGVGQGIAGLPPFSGLGYRLVVWVVITSITLVYLLVYARRAQRAPDTAPGGEAPAEPLTRRHLAALGVVAAALALVVAGTLRWGWGLAELAGLFVAVAVVAGPVGGLGADRTAEKFLEGAAGIAAGALVVGLARGVLVIFDGARVTDTILHSMAAHVAGLPAAVTVLGIYVVQIAISYVVPSGSGQAALCLPILVPLGDLVGVTRQTSVLAYQFGDGFSNVFTPTSGYFMAALALARVPWTRWARFMAPLQALWIAAGAVLLLVAHAIRYGPF